MLHANGTSVWREYDALVDEFMQAAATPLHRIRKISASIATAVADLAHENGLATEPRPDDVRAFIEGRMYDPTYERYT